MSGFFKNDVEEKYQNIIKDFLKDRNIQYTINMGAFPEVYSKLEEFCNDKYSEITPTYGLLFALTALFLDAGIDFYGRIIFPYQFACLKSTNVFILPDSVLDIRDKAFYSSGINGILIPKSVTKINTYAFNSSSIRVINYEGTKEEWNKILIYSDTYPLPAKSLDRRNIRIVCKDGVLYS